MLRTAGTILSDNLENVVTAWPDFDAIHQFRYELADALLAAEGRDGVDDLRQHLAAVGWAGGQIESLREEYQSRLRSVDAATARGLRKQAFARFSDVLDEVEDDLVAVGEARDILRELPDIRPDEPTIVVAGLPNVGKTSFVNHVTNADHETAAYPFTTTQIHVGHVDWPPADAGDVPAAHVRYQLVDTPGLLDRPPAERNAVERQAVSALTHLADAVLVLLDPTGASGYPIEAQRSLRDDVVDRFDAPVITVGTKSDRSTDVPADYHMSVVADDNVETVLGAAIEAVGHEPELPFERQDRRRTG